MLTLDHWGLRRSGTDPDARIRDSSIISQALLAGNIDAAYLSYSFAKVVENKGFRVLADLQKLPIAYQGTGIVTRRSTIASSAATLENVD
jgi:ABC-type nitrate/sulfonate/bicarbonate transport system substrate-binding protein